VDEFVVGRFFPDPGSPLAIRALRSRQVSWHIRVTCRTSKFRSAPPPDSSR
jgi:hypothetical protein